jgi:hypothetical protein
MKIKIYKSVILCVTLRGCEIWSVTQREEHSLRWFENRLVTRIFGPKREEVTRRLEKTGLFVPFTKGDKLIFIAHI